MKKLSFPSDIIIFLLIIDIIIIIASLVRGNKPEMIFLLGLPILGAILIIINYSKFKG